MSIYNTLLAQYKNYSDEPPVPPTPGPDYSEPFYVEDVSGETNVLVVKKPYSEHDYNISLEYSFDKENWSVYGPGAYENPTELTIQPYQKVYLRCSTDTWCYVPNSTYYSNGLLVSKRFNTGGNIMSLLYGSSFTGNERTLPNPNEKYIFYNLFWPNAVNPMVRTNILLPLTEMADYCYNGMFRKCNLLENAPELPATTLARSCYGYMFFGCSSLTTAPALPLTTLSPYCYSYMFSGCASLTTAPNLPATTIPDSCYSGMFSSCTSLTTAPSLPGTTFEKGCYQYMFQGCTSLTTVPELPVTTLTKNCYYGMFRNCTGITSIPSNYLPSTTLAESCYSNMFSGCTSLTNAPELPATTLVTTCYEYMFEGCTSLNYIKVGFTTWPNLSSSSASDYRATRGWTKLTVDTTGTFVCPAALPQAFNKSGNNTGGSYIYNYTNAIPYGWTVETF